MCSHLNIRYLNIPNPLNVNFKSVLHYYTSCIDIYIFITNYYK